MTRDRRTFRLFVSSTFSDLVAERSALQHIVFPALKQLSLRLACRFQDVDLRWGISTEAGLDQTTMRVCLREVARCQETTPRPNFVILLGDRYGWCPLPFEIPADEFARLDPIGSAGRELLTRWYQRDDNAVPPVYRLQPRERGSEFEDGSVWSSRVERPLHDLLGEATAGWPDSVRARYTASATEQEIISGALAVPDARDHVFCFIRELRDAPEEAREAGFLDPEPDARARVHDLRTRLTTLLGPNVHRYTATWLGQDRIAVPLPRCLAAVERAGDLVRQLIGAVPADDLAWQRLTAQAVQAAGRVTDTGAGPLSSPISLDHLPALCTDVFLRLARIILGEAAYQEQIEPAQREAEAHRGFGAGRSAVFAGRDQELAEIEAYVRAGPPHPLCVIGEPGSGKTALLARAAEKFSDWVPECRRFVRFIGATPESTDGRSLLRDLWTTLGHREPPASFTELARSLPEFLSRVSSERPLILVLDAIDMLSEADRADRLAWLPRSLPPRVRLILSTVPGERADTLRRRLADAPRLTVGTLAEPEARWLLDQWLSRACRTLTAAQVEHVITAFRRAPLPLYLKLAFEAACEWTSDREPPELGESAEAMIEALFDRLSAESNHGPDLVERCLAYLAAGRHGLTEDELLDALSRDEEVMASFRRRSPRSPPVTRLPVVIWSRLYYDLQAYLSEQSADGTSVFTFYHQQVRRVARDRYLVPARAARHRHLAGLFSSDARLAITTRTGAATFNLRKLSEEAYQQTLGESWLSLGDTLGRLDWLQAKVESGLGYDAIADFSRALKAFPTASRPRNDELETFREVLSAYARAFGQEFHAFAPWPRTAAQQMHNNLTASSSWSDEPVTRRLRAFASNPYPGGSVWLRRLSAGPATAVPRQLLRTLPAHEGMVTTAAVSPDGAWLATGGVDGMVRVWDAKYGSQAANIPAGPGPVAGVAWSGTGPDHQLMAGGQGGWVRTWDWEAERLLSSYDLPGDRHRCFVRLPGGEMASGADDFAVRVGSDREPTRVLHRHRDRVLCLATDREGALVVSGSADRTLRLTALRNGAPALVFRGSERDVRAVCVDPGARWIASGEETGTIRIWDVASQSPRRQIAAHRHWVTSLAVLPRRNLLLSASTDRTIGAWDLESGQRHALFRGHRRGVTCLAAAPDQTWFVSGGEDGSVCFWLAPEPGPLSRGSTGEHEGPVNCLHALPGRRVASGSEDKTVRIWESDGAPGSVLHGHQSPVTALAHSGTRVISAGLDSTVRSWPLDTQDAAETLGGGGGPGVIRPGHQRPVRALVPLADERVASTGDDGTVWLWSPTGGRPPQRLGSVSGALTALAVGPDWVAAGGTPRELTVWDLTGGAARSFPVHEGPTTCLAGDDNGRIVTGGLDGRAVLTELASGQSGAIASGLGKIRSVALGPHSNCAVGCEDGAIAYWLTPVVPPIRLLAHREPVRILAMAPASGWLASGCDEGRICLWDISTGRLLGTALVAGSVTAMRPVSPDRLWVATSNAAVMVFQVITGG